MLLSHAYCCWVPSVGMMLGYPVWVINMYSHYTLTTPIYIHICYNAII